MATRDPSRDMRATIVVALLLLLPLAVPSSPAIGAAPAASPAAVSGSPSKAGHERMVALLREIAERTSAEHPLLGDRIMRQLRGELASLPPDAPARRRVTLLMQLGEQELRQNEIDSGVAHLESAHREMERLFTEGRVRAPAVYSTSYRLGVARLRQAETQNCCQRRSAESCILPLRGEGIHRRQEGSRRAIESLTRALRMAPPTSEVHLKALWLLNLAYMTIDGYPGDVPETYRIRPERFRSSEALPRFANRAPALRLDSFDLAGGAIVDDFDNDGYLDLVASTYDPAEPLRYFRNDRDGTFSDRTRPANLEGILGGFNLMHADFDNDGDLDVLVLRGAWLGRTGQIPNSLLRNNGDGTFTDVTFDAGLGEVHYPTQTADWADYDLDGDLDLYVGNEAVLDFHPPCQLFRNNGDGTFTDVAERAGVQNLRFAKSVGWGDYDDDGDPDLYVSNLGQPNRLYRNNGDGTFTDVAPRLGVTGPEMSFAAWFWDFDNDGVLDLFVAAYDWSAGNLAAYVRSNLGRPNGDELPRLYRGDGRGGFEEVGRSRGLTEVTLPMGANYGDLDNDGFLDFYLGTGYPDYEALVPNAMYRNHAGRRFVDVTYSGGFGHLQKGHGIAFADLDNDGDQDVFAQMGGFFLGDRFANALFENPGFGNRWLTVRLEGRRSNRPGIGARLRVDLVEGDARRSVYRNVDSGGSFGANPLRQTLGLGRAERIERLEVRWPGGGEPQVFGDVPLDSALHIVEGAERFTLLRLEPLRLAGPPGAPQGRSR